jgi:hypothetical protein
MTIPFAGRLQGVLRSLVLRDSASPVSGANVGTQGYDSIGFDEASIQYTLIRDPSKNSDFIKDIVPRVRASKGKRDSLLGLVHFEMNDVEAAFSYWSSALRHEPDNKGYLAAAAIAGCRLGRPVPAAEQHFEAVDPSTYSFSAGRFDQRQLEQALKSYGFFIVRGALELKGLDALRENFEKNIEGSRALLQELGIDPINAVYPTWCLAPTNDPSKLTTRLRDGWGQKNVTALKFYGEAERAYLSEAFFSLLGTSIIQLIAEFSGRGNIEVQHDYCMARAIAAASNSEFMTGFAKLHQDARLQARFDDFLTVFIAFTPCGLDRPTIGAVPAGLDIYFPQSCDISELPPFLYHKAVLEPGDLWIHTGMTAHGSYQSQDMVPNLPRLSVDVRIFDRVNAR